MTPTAPSDNERVTLKCSWCAARLGTVTVLGPDAPTGPLHVVVSVDCALCLRPTVLILRYEIVAPRLPRGGRRRLPPPGRSR